MKPITLISLILLCAGCAATRPGNPIHDRPIEENEHLISEPTPSEWKAGSVWTFVQYGDDGSTALDVTFRVTDKPAQTCSSGDWRELELVKGRIADGSVRFRQAYSVSGRLLTLDMTGWCDLGKIQGALSEGSFLGQTTGGPFTRGRFVPQRVLGRRLR